MDMAERFLRNVPAHDIASLQAPRMDTRERELSAIRIRLYCERCGFPPDRVALTRTVYPPAYGIPTHEDWPFP
jgi:hypothetical protein